ncbi:MAG: 6-phosphofructokinase [Candidatus Omnitrophota bacterium]
MATDQKRLAVLTSGGDAPGMNAAVRSVVRTGIAQGLSIWGVQRGYQGLLEGAFYEMGLRDVSNIIQRGGTVLKTARSEEFKTTQGIQKAKEILEKCGISGLVAIGGDGTFRGAVELEKAWRGRVIGVPGTIDNDLYGTDFTIGYDTAVNTALEAIDRIRDTADAHERFFLVEVMGRHSGFIALDVGIAGGAEEVLVPEVTTDIQKVCERICAWKARGKLSSIIVVAEGDDAGGAFEIAEKLKTMSHFEYRVVVLGHIQRGGAPTARDRILATKLGAFAVDVFLKGERGVMAGEVNGKLCTTPFAETWSRKKPLDTYLWDLIPKLSL